MINEKQNARMANKVAALENFYAEFTVKKRTRINSVLFFEKTDGESVNIESEKRATTQSEKTPQPRKIASGEKWGGDFVYGNFTFSLSQPCVIEPVTGAIENTVYANGVPVGLTDVSLNAREAVFRMHRYIEVPAGEITIEGYAGHTYYGTMPRDKKQTFFFNGYFPQREFDGIYIVEFDEPIKNLVFLLKYLNSCFRAADEYGKSEITDVYEQLFVALPLNRKPNSSEVTAAVSILENYLNAIKPAQKPYVGAVGHSHLDTAWLWPVDETKRKAVRTASNAVKLLKKYPSYQFVMSSILYYDWFKKENLALYADIKKLVAEGRFEPTAGWVECDCNLTGGESLCRQFLRGARFCKTEFGFVPKVFWLPDTFGYSAALPQIMQKSGTEYFLTTKLSWNDTNKFEYDTFNWSGLDGSTVKVHFNTIQSRFDPQSVAERARGIAHKGKRASALMAYGYGDGGAGPSDDMVHEAVLTENCAHAKTEHTGVTAFMDGLSGELPEWHDELYLELHRGTLTSVADLKRLNRKAENALHNAEFLAVAGGDNSAAPFLDECLCAMLLNQFHDILPGTSIARVNDKAKAQLGGALKKLEAYCQTAAGNGQVPLNTLSFAREESVFVSGAAGEHVYEGLDGKKASVLYAAMPPFGSGKLLPRTKSVAFDGETVTTPFYTAKVINGAIVSFVYNGRELCKGKLGELTVGEDFPLQWDNWDIDADYALKRKPAKLTNQTSFFCGGALFLRQTFKISEKTTLKRDVIFDPCDALIRFDNITEFNDDHTLLTVEFDTALFSPRIKSEVQFGFIERSVYADTSVTQAKFEFVNHRWSDLNEEDVGLALLNDCKYGAHCRGGKLGLTLLKSGTHPDERGERGLKRFSYALYPHGRGTADVTQKAAAFNNSPLLGTTQIAPFVQIDNDAVICETVKPAEDGGITLRLYECTRSQAKATLKFNSTYAFYNSDIPELNITPLGKSDTLTLSFAPFEIKTIVLKAHKV